MQGTDNFLIQLGLPPFPDDSIPAEVYDDFLTVHRAIQNLLRGVSKYCGIDAPSSDIWSAIPYTETQLQGNLTRLYPTASVDILRGQAVNLYNDAGALRCRLAQANSMTTMAHGIANSAASAGEQLEINTFDGFVDSVGGLTIGTVYYLSPSVAGAVQNFAPVSAGQIVQPVGLAIGTNSLIMKIPLNPRQL
jgi:predicted transcriptional regulator